MKFVIFSLALALWRDEQLNGLTPGHVLHEREVAKLLFVPRYGPLSLLDHVIDRLADTWVRITDFLNLCADSEWFTNPTQRAAISQSVSYAP
jgi:hypothetical protein